MWQPRKRNEVIIFGDDVVNHQINNLKNLLDSDKNTEFEDVFSYEKD